MRSINAPTGEAAAFTLDTSYTEGYKSSSVAEKKTAGSRNHIFANLNYIFNEDDSYESNLEFKLQRTSNDKYFKKHDINTALVDSENTNLESEIKYSFAKDDMFFDIAASVYEDLSVKSFLLGNKDEQDNQEVMADAYVSALPVDLFKLLIPKEWLSNTTSKSSEYAPFVALIIILISAFGNRSYK